MNLLIVGPPASGKGTQAEKLAEKFNLAHIEMGGLLRSISKEQTPLGQKVKKSLEEGKLVADGVVAEVINNYLQSIGRLDGILFDGFPRIVSQAEYFEKFIQGKGIKLEAVVYLTLPPEEILKRLLNRRTCGQCGKVFNLVTKPPKTKDICDFCGGKLIARSDETSLKSKVRIEWFKKEVLPMIDYYKQKGLVEEVDGDRPVEVIFADIVERLKKRRLL